MVSRNLVVALDPNLAFRISAAGMGDGPVPSPMTFQHLERVVFTLAHLSIIHLR
jgi:hypothetical protein